MPGRSGWCDYLAVSMVGIGLFVFSTQAMAQCTGDMSFVPRGIMDATTGDRLALPAGASLAGDTLTLEQGGVLVEMEVLINFAGQVPRCSNNMGPQGCTIEDAQAQKTCPLGGGGTCVLAPCKLGTAQLKIDMTTSGSPVGLNNGIGAPLTLRGFSGGNFGQGGFISTLECFNNGRAGCDPGNGFPACDGDILNGEGPCVGRADFVMGGQVPAPTAVVSFPDENYKYILVSQSGGQEQNGRSYMGTLLVEVPVGAAGLYELAIDPNPAQTFLSDDFVGDIPRNFLASGFIHIITGSCCFGLASQGQEGCSENQTIATCTDASFPGGVLFRPGVGCGVACPLCTQNIDCNGNGTPDQCEISSGMSLDCNNNAVPDECDIATMASMDCNGNAIPDECDLTAMTSSDCNGNAVPDECDIDVTSSAPGGPFFCSHSCDPDCNNNGVPDSCDIATGTSLDVDANGIPDECDVWDNEAGNNNWSTATNWLGNTVPGVGDKAVIDGNIAPSAFVNLDLPVTIDLLRLRNNAGINAIGAAGEDLTVTGSGGLVMSGPEVGVPQASLLVANDRTISVANGPVVLNATALYQAAAGSSSVSASLSAALRYAERGYPVFPCAPGGKAPITPHGFKNASTDPAVIEAWWARHPHANVGMATAGLFVIDVDGRDNPWPSDPDRSQDLACCGPVSLTPRGGRHYIFRQPEGKDWKNTVGKLAPKVDTRADGGYIVVPPSVVEGKPYRWSEARELQAGLEQLPEPPDWVAVHLEGPGALIARRAPGGSERAVYRRRSCMTELRHFLDDWRFSFGGGDSGSGSPGFQSGKRSLFSSNQVLISCTYSVADSSRERSDRSSTDLRISSSGQPNDL